MVAAASYPAGVLVEKHAGLVGAHTRQASWVGPQVFRWLGLAAWSILYEAQTFSAPINWIGIATVVA